MFTGLIEKVGTLESLKRAGEGYRISISHDPWSTPLEHGESVAVNGACLSVSEFSDKYFVCDVLDETIDKTNLGIIGENSPVNLERAMQAGARFGGHMVSGHVDTVGTVSAVTDRGRDKVITVTCGEKIAAETVEKGSITLNGVSLTVTSVANDSLEVNIIPLTWDHTNLCKLQKGASVNLESDLIGKYVRKALTGMPAEKTGLTEADLRNAGF